MDIFVIGGSQGKTLVGRRALIRRFVTGEFSDDDPSQMHWSDRNGSFFASADCIGCDSLDHTIKIDEEDVCLKLWFPIVFDGVKGSVLLSYLRYATPRPSSVMLVFDVTDKDSFDQARSYFNEIKQHKQKQGAVFRALLVGNKIDLVSKRVVDKLTATRFCEEVGIPYIETSAKTSEGVTEAFTLAAKMGLAITPDSNDDNTATPKTTTSWLSPSGICLLM